MKKCNCKIRNTLGKYQKIWPWIGVAGYAVDGAEAAVDGGLTGDEVLRKCADGKSCAQKDEGRTPQDAEVHWLKG